ATRSQKPCGNSRRCLGCIERVGPRQPQYAVLACRRQRIEDTPASKGALRRLIAQDESLSRPCGDRPIDVECRHGRLVWLDGLAGEERDTAGKILSTDVQVAPSPMAERPFAPQKAQFDLEALARLIAASDDPNTAPQVVSFDPRKIDSPAIAGFN